MKHIVKEITQEEERAVRIVNTYSPSYPRQEGIEGTSFLAVLTHDGESYRAYVGLVALHSTLVCTDRAEYMQKREEAASWVALCGQKLGYTEACCHFPNLGEDDYRA